MKKAITFLLSLSVVVYWSGASIYAQTKGHSSVPNLPQSQSQGHSSDHAKSDSINQSQSGHSNSHETKPDWQTKLNDRFQNDSAFQTRMKDLLPAGMDLKTAEDGFKNRGQFIAALHVSKNLGISFDLLKAKMTGTSVDAATGQTTTTTPMSLGKAIHELQPTIPQDQANIQAKDAEKQAEVTVKISPTS
jgi:hypothetical protein